jgi:Holliday junction resolvase RusA-like endonuclease
VLARAVIEGRPVPKGRPRFAQKDRWGRQLAHPRTYTPAATEAAEDAVRLAILTQNPGIKPTSLTVAVDLTFYRASRGDLDNLVKLVLDAANGIVWADDKQVCSINARVFRKAKGDPRTLLEVEEWQ